MNVSAQKFLLLLPVSSTEYRERVYRWRIARRAHNPRGFHRADSSSWKPPLRQEMLMPLAMGVSSSPPDRLEQ